MRPYLRREFHSFPFLLFLSFLRTQQRFDRAALVHRAIAVGDLLERQHDVEHFSWTDRPGEDQIDQLWQISPHGRRTAEQTDVPEEEIRAVERDTVRHADVADRTARPRRLDRLPHRLLGPDTLQHRIGADTVRQLLDALDALVAALRHNVGRTKFARELLPRVVAAHRDDAFGTHLLRREHAEESDGTVTHDNNRRTGYHVRRIGGQPARAHHLRP